MSVLLKRVRPCVTRVLVVATKVSGRGVTGSTCKFSDVSMSNDNLLVDLDAKTGIALVKLNRRPANCFDLGFCLQLSETVKKLEADSNCRAMILTSGIKGIFSGGLELGELYKPKRDFVVKFIEAFHQLWLDIYSSPLVMISAINGSCPAGGCILAVATDYRVMSTEKGQIGISAVQVGLPIRRWIFEPYARLIGQRRAELAVLRATLFKPEEALAVGLVDEVAANDEQLLIKSTDAANSFLSLPDHARRESKLICRKPVIDNAVAECKEMLEVFADSVMYEEMQRTLDKYARNFKTKK